MEEWLKQVKDLLEEAEDLLQICSTLLGRTSCTNIWSEWKYSKKLSNLTNRIKECVLEHAALAALPRMEAVRIVLLKLFEKTDPLSKKTEDLAEMYEGSSLEHRNLLQAMNEEYKKLLHDTIVEFSKYMVPKDEQWDCGAFTNPSEDPLASKLKTLSDRTGRDRRCKVNLEIAELTDRPGQFHPPLDIVPCEPEPSAAPPEHRGTAVEGVEGGYEVNSDTSVQFTFEVTFADTWFFYILCLDRTAEGSRPVIAFPHVWGTRTIIMHCVKGNPKFSVVRKWSANQVRTWFFVEFD